MTDDEWQYDTDDLEEPAGDRAVDDQSSDDDSEDPADDGGWRFSVDDVEEGGTVDDQAEGWLNLHEEIEAGSPTLENVLFVAIGVALALFLAWQLFL